MKNKNIYIILGSLIIFVIGFIFLNSSKSEPVSQTTVKQELIPIDSITHGHGLAVDVTDPNIIYIATHHGLLELKNEKDLYRVGSVQDDYMGFSPHPINPKIFFSSGHPQTGGNIGFQKSEDGGFTWRKISNGINGPVDFHAMTVSPANPDLIYGWYRGTLQRTTDGGKNWEVVSTTNFPIVSLAADPKDENVVYAATPQGLMISKNKGSEWSTLLEGFVSVVAIHPQDSQKLLSYSEKQQLAKSNDGGKSWAKIAQDLRGETPLYISFNKKQPEVVYLLTEKNSIYKSTGSGSSWSKIR